MQVGEIEASSGEHIFGYLKVAKSRSGLSPDIPVHLFVGAEPGPTFLVQAAIHGDEIVGTLGVLNFAKRLDPKRIRGCVIVVPVVNRIGFELSERLSRVDGKDISRLFPGNPNGTLSEQIAFVYMEKVIKRANVMLDIHSGGRTGYERYVMFTGPKDRQNLTEKERNVRKLAVAFGLDSAAYFAPGAFGGGRRAHDAIEEAGVVEFGVEMGGGTGWLKNGEANLRDLERGILNTMKSMHMTEGDFEVDGPLCTIYNASIILWKPAVDGLFVRKKDFYEKIQAGEIFGTVVDPYTGKNLEHVKSGADAIVLPGGQQWPTLAGTSVVELGVIDEVVDRRKVNLHVSF